MTFAIPTVPLLLATCAFAQLESPPRATDLDPDPRVVETVLTASVGRMELVPGQLTDVYTFNGSIPGPTIEANVGDTLVVHFVNALPEASSIHWHGVATPSTMDGSELAQTAVPRSGYFRYEFVLNVAGTFWYHPHVRTNEQVERGLYGALIVRDPREDAALGLDPRDERVVFLDDIKLDENGAIAPFATDLGAPLEPWQRAEDLANSRIGNHVLVNGRAVTFDVRPCLAPAADRPVRLRLLNAASGQVFRLDLTGGADATLWAIGSDQGLWNTAERVPHIDLVKNPLGHHDELISNPDTRTGLTLTPGDRLDAVLVPGGTAPFAIRSHDYQKGKHVAFVDPQGRLLYGHDHFDGAGEAIDLIDVRPEGSPAATPWTPPAALRSTPILPLEPSLDLPPLAAFFGHSQPDPETGNVMFFVTVDRAEELLAAVHAGHAAEPIDYDPRPMMRHRAEDGLHVRHGEVRTLEVVNFTGNVHNVHLHGFRFQHLGTRHVDLDEPANCREEVPARLAFEDTLRIERRPGTVLGRSYTITRLAVRFDDGDLPPELRRARSEILASGMAPSPSRSGGWLLHCHMLEHSARGMMTFVQVGR